MKLIAKNRTKAIQGRLEAFREVTYYTQENSYQGETVAQPLDAKTISIVMDDIKEGHAKLWYNVLNDTYELHYAHPCKWVMKK